MTLLSWMTWVTQPVMHTIFTWLNSVMSIADVVTFQHSMLETIIPMILKSNVAPI